MIIEIIETVKPVTKYNKIANGIAVLDNHILVFDVYKKTTSYKSEITDIYIYY